MGDDSESVVGDLGKAWDAAVDAVDDVGSAAGQMGHAMVEGAEGWGDQVAGAADFLVGDYDDAHARQQAAEEHFATRDAHEHLANDVYLFSAEDHAEAAAEQLGHAWAAAADAAGDAASGAAIMGAAFDQGVQGWGDQIAGSADHLIGDDAGATAYAQAADAHFRVGDDLEDQAGQQFGDAYTDVVGE